MMADEEGASVNAFHVEAIGFGTEASLDGGLLTKLASEHRGIYARADSGLDLKKFFSFAFGRIFEAGTLVDPEFDLAAGQAAGAPSTSRSAARRRSPSSRAGTTRAPSFSSR